MSKKSSSFKRKLKTKPHGMVYYRIWGWDIKHDNLEYWIEKVKNSDGRYALISYEGHHIILSIYRDMIGVSDYDGKHQIVSDKRIRAMKMMNGSLTNGCYFRTFQQASKELQMYASGCKTEALDELIEYHEQLDQFDNEYFD